MSQPLSQSNILFPHQANTPKFSSTLSSLKRSALSVHNRLASIKSDSDFVVSVAEAYQLPLVANERCGSWYIPPEKKLDGVYFKSTDGHMGEWGFSLRRLNLQLLDVVQKYGGAVVVDSTRRGKSMPDALSKTIPIWCTVINRAVFDAEGQHPLSTPPQAVSQSEHAQIESRIDGRVRQFIDICKPNIPDLRAKLHKPLRPIWVTQQSSLPEVTPSFTEFHPIVLCTASRRVHGAEASENGYVQGAADDHEAWSHGLTPAVFWKNRHFLMRTSEEDATSVIAKLLRDDPNDGTNTTAALIKPTSSLYISSSQNLDLTHFDVVISCAPIPYQPEIIKDAKVNHYLPLKCSTGKLGSRDLRNELPHVTTFLSSLPPTTSGKILVCCLTGKDLSVGTALAILCVYADDNGNLDFTKPRAAAGIDKNFIKQRLSWITTSNPALNPSRATLQSVNAVLLTTQDPKLAAALPVRSKDTTSPPDTQEPEINDKEPGPSLPMQIFSTLQNHTWTFHRTLSSTLPTHPNGTVTGRATFTSCTLPSTFPSTLLYAEEGDFVTTTGLRFSARRKYVYQLARNEDMEGREEGIVVKFFDDEKFPRAKIEDGVGPAGQGVGGLFVEMDVLTPSPSTTTSATRHTSGTSTDGQVYEASNKEQHLCAEDLYTASWKFGPGMLGGKDSEDGMWWEVRYDVKGPKKDYDSVTRYEKG
ncbi:tRNA A64-2'-O-ribosylphosphate transferase [Setomelanomma holmii]|uniref:tRNA A64-2'-O-ribosylphosphate transferase n=1 Tax=Setomelanomma holmii TaxID=210430 RepID=A0A9P4LJB6_9PLEO|nr:tRNA A64-2'-O-ribosylphosphate transferase [Setomelanomma holmii]